MFFTQCNVHDLECNVHDSVLLSNKDENTTQKKYLPVHNLSVTIYLKNNINGFKLSLQNSQEFRVEDLYLGTRFLQLYRPWQPHLFKYNFWEKSSFDEFSTKHATLPYLS